MLKGVVAAVATAGLTLLSVPPALADPSDQSEALAQIIAVDALGLDVLDAGVTLAGNPSDPEPTENGLDVDVLNTVQVDIGGVSVPLIRQGETGLLDLGGAGAGVLRSYAVAPSPGSATASAGSLGEDGSITLDPGGVGEPGSATVSLTPLLDQVGVDGLTADIVDELTLELGALASTATANGTSVTSDYIVADGQLRISSPLVDGLSGDLDEVLGGVRTTVDGTLATDGLLGQVADDAAIDLDLGLVAVEAGGGAIGIAASENPDYSDTLAEALGDASSTLLTEPLEDESGLVSIDLQDGTIAVDLQQLGGEQGLNGLDPNFELLDADNIALITGAVSEALGGFTTTVGEVIEDELLNTVGLRIELPATVTTLGLPAASVDIVVDTTLGQLAGTDPSDPTIEIEGDLLGIIDLGELLDGLLPEVETLLIAPLQAVVDEAVGAATDGLTETLDDAVDPLLETLSPVLSGVLSEVVSITINEQPTLLTPAEPGDLGAESFTVTALSLELLPDVDAVVIDLASSTVRAAAATPTVSVDPGTVADGETTAVAGSGYPATTDITVQLQDADGAPVGDPVAATTDETGAFTTDLTVPEGTTAGDHQVAATATSGETATAPLTVTNDDAGVPTPVIGVDPGVVDDGESTTVTGAGFPPTTAVGVQLTDPEGDPVGDPVTVTTDENGAFTAEVTVPEGTDAGDYVVEAVAETGEPATDALVVTNDGAGVEEPVVGVAPATVNDGESTTVTGEGFPAVTEVEVQLQDAEGNAVGDPVTVTTDENGGFATELTVPAGTPAGDFLVAATAETGESATDALSVTNADAGTDEPAITVDPRTVDDGDSTTVTGEGFPPTTEVEVQLTDAEGAPVGDPVTATTDENGDFTTEITVPEGTEPGDYVVEAVAETGESATDALVVTNGGVGVEEPVVWVAPGAVNDGESTAVTGVGYPTSTEVEVQLQDADGNVVGDPVTVTTDENGRFTTDLTVPAGTPAGDFTVAATAETGESATDALVVTNTASGAEDPVIWVDPGVVDPGDSTTVNGEDFPPNTEVEVQLTDPDGTPVGDPVTVVTDDNGDFTTELTVPEGTEPGDYTVEAEAETGESASDALRVDAPGAGAEEPAISVDPGEVDPGESTTVTGEDFPPNTEVVIVVTDPDGNPIGDLITVVTDDDGGFTVDVTIPEGAAPGDYTVEAEAETGETATDTVTVTDGSGTGTEEPNLTVDPGTVDDGDSTTVIGENFPPNTEVVVVVTGPDGNPVSDPVTVVADESGDFALEITIPEGAAPGDYTVEAEAATGETATVMFTVTDGAGNGGGDDADGDAVGGGDSAPGGSGGTGSGNSGSGWYGSDSGGPGSLARTGADGASTLAGVAAMLLLGGCAGVFLSRRSMS